MFAYLILFKSNTDDDVDVDVKTRILCDCVIAFFLVVCVVYVDLVQ